MIRASRRHAFPALVLVCLAAVPIWIHATQAPTFDPCPGASALLAADRIGGGTVTEREVSESEVPGAGSVDGKIEGRGLRSAEFGFRVERGFEPHPFFGLKRVNDFDITYPMDGRVEPVRLESGGTTLVVYETEDRLGPNYRVRTHVFVHDRRPVSEVFWSDLRLAGEQLLGGTRPVTLFVVQGLGRIVEEARIRDVARTWILEAWREYEQACSSS